LNNFESGHANPFQIIKNLKHILAIAARLACCVISPTTSNGSGIPQIVAQPQNQMVLIGSNATFSVSAAGDNLNYQWYYGATAISGATNIILMLTNIYDSQAYYYCTVSVTNLAGGVTSSNAILTVLTVLRGPINPYTPGTLGYDLFQGSYALASSTNQTGSYFSSNASLGTNSAVWTWAVNLSCVGYSSDGYQAVLIASDKLLTCAHYDGEWGQTVIFHDTNGVVWTGVVTNVINVIADMDIAMLSNAAPESIVIPYVLPPNYINYIAGNSLLGMPAFWLHKNTTHIDYAPVAEVADANWYGYGTWMDVAHDGSGLYSGTPASGGDSGSPAFMSLSNHPVLLFATTLSPEAAGMFVSGHANWNSLAALDLTNGLNILDLSSYPLQSPVPPPADYNCLVPPANQMASPGALVTFGAGVYVFEASPSAYQWQLNGTNLVGATNATLTIEAVTNNVGSYSVIVSNDLGSVMSGPATLQLQDNGIQPNAPYLTVQLTNVNSLAVSWTAQAGVYLLQQNLDLNPMNWTTVTNYVNVTNSQNQVMISPASGNNFYRLINSVNVSESEIHRLSKP
jgi:hypothetical protein